MVEFGMSRSQALYTNKKLWYQLSSRGSCDSYVVIPALSCKTKVVLPEVYKYFMSPFYIYQN